MRADCAVMCLPLLIEVPSYVFPPAVYTKMSLQHGGLLQDLKSSSQRFPVQSQTGTYKNVMVQNCQDTQLEIIIIKLMP